MLSIKQNIITRSGPEITKGIHKSDDVAVKVSEPKNKKIEKSEVSSFSSDKIEIKLRGLAETERSLQNGISEIQSSDSLLSDAEGILRQMRELAGKVFGGNLADRDRAELHNRFDELKAQINNGSSGKSPKDIMISSGLSAMSFSSHVAAISINSQFAFNELADRLQYGDVFRIPVEPVNSESLEIEDAVLNSEVSAEEAISSVDKALKRVGSQREEFGKILSGLTESMNRISSMVGNLTAAGESVSSADSAAEAMKNTKSQLAEHFSEMLSAHGGSLSDSALKLLK